MKIPEEISTTILGAKNIVLFTHVHPDGDALGSILGFADILENLNKKVLCYLEESVPYLYNFLPGCERVTTSLEEVLDFAERNHDVVAISLDCGDSDRLGKNKQEFLGIQPFLVIDHHRSHKNFGSYRWVDPEKSSTGEMVYELAHHLGAEISYQCAYNLYVAITTDTGSFKYDSTSARTLRIAADLVEKGISPHDVSCKTYNNYTVARLRLMELVLGTLKIYKSGQLALIRVNQSMFAETGALPVDIEGFIDFPRSIDSVKVAAFIKEGRNGQVSVSLRAKGECDVAAIAKSYGGGGHRNASGFRFTDKSLDEVQSLVLDALKKAVDSPLVA